MSLKMNAAGQHHQGVDLDAAVYAFDGSPRPVAADKTGQQWLVEVRRIGEGAGQELVIAAQVVVLHVEGRGVPAVDAEGLPAQAEAAPIAPGVHVPRVCLLVEQVQAPAHGTGIGAEVEVAHEL